jgi:hypothetical protein
VTRGFNGGDWGGTGVTSGAAFADQTFATALGVANNADIGYTDMGGETGLTGSEILVRYTYYGDADLSGGVDNADLLSFQDGLAPASPKIWLTGDFDYDGQVGNSDLLAFQDGLAASRRAASLLTATGTTATLAASRSTARPAAAPPHSSQGVVGGRAQPPTRSNAPLRVKP